MASLEELRKKHSEVVLQIEQENTVYKRLVRKGDKEAATTLRKQINRLSATAVACQKQIDDLFPPLKFRVKKTTD